MAKIVGGINVTHVPYIGRAIANNLQQDAYWKPFFDGFPPVRDWLEEQRQVWEARLDRLDDYVKSVAG